MGLSDAVGPLTLVLIHFYFMADFRKG
jgi:hypothetical protein